MTKFSIPLPPLLCLNNLRRKCLLFPWHFLKMCSINLLKWPAIAIRKIFIKVRAEYSAITFYRILLIPFIYYNHFLHPHCDRFPMNCSLVSWCLNYKIWEMKSMTWYLHLWCLVDYIFWRYILLSLAHFTHGKEGIGLINTCKKDTHFRRVVSESPI